MQTDEFIYIERDEQKNKEDKKRIARTPFYIALVVLGLMVFEAIIVASFFYFEVGLGIVFIALFIAVVTVNIGVTAIKEISDNKTNAERRSVDHPWNRIHTGNLQVSDQIAVHGVLIDCEEVDYEGICFTFISPGDQKAEKHKCYYFNIMDRDGLLEKVQYYLHKDKVDAMWNQNKDQESLVAIEKEEYQENQEDSKEDAVEERQSKVTLMQLWELDERLIKDIFSFPSDKLRVYEARWSQEYMHLEGILVKNGMTEKMTPTFIDRVEFQVENGSFVDIFYLSEKEFYDIPNFGKITLDIFKRVVLQAQKTERERRKGNVVR